MSAVKSDKYAHINDAQKIVFVDRCVNENVDPKVQCPVCYGRRLRREPMFRFCDEHTNYEMGGVRVWCHRCKMQYRVLGTWEGHEQDQTTVSDAVAVCDEAPAVPQEL